MLTTIEGIYHQGTITLREKPPKLQQSRVLVTFLPEPTPASLTGQMRFGQFSGDPLPSEEDFQITQWQGETEFDDL